MNQLNKFWPLLAIILVVVASVALHTPPTMMALTFVGLLYVLAANYHTIYTNYFGALFTLGLGMVSFSEGVYGNAAVNVLVLLPMCIYGIYGWNKKKIKLELTPRQNTYILGITLALSTVVYYALGYAGGTFQLMDALTTVLPIVATFLLVIQSPACWPYWIVYNTLQAILWFDVAGVSSSVASLAVLKLVFLANSIIAYFNWKYKA